MMNFIGQIFQNEQNQLILNTVKREVSAFFYTKKLGGAPLNIQHNVVLVAERIEDETERTGPKIFCRVIEIRSNPKTLSSYEASVPTFDATATLEPIREIDSDGYDGEVRTQNLHGFKLRFPTEIEVSEVLGVSKEGMCLGELSAYNQTEYHYLPQKLYESVFVTGVKGTGKTNGLKLLIETCANTKEKPAIVVIDLEGMPHEYASLNVPFERITISPIGAEDGYSLSMGELPPEDLQYFIPELPSKSADLLDKLSRNAYATFESSNQKVNKVHLLTRIQHAASSDATIHFAQRPAILRALQSSNLELFDQVGKKVLTASELLSPGKVTVIDLSKLEHDSRQCAAALYILTILHKSQLRRGATSGLVLVIDEAHRIFPRQVGAEPRKEYFRRVARKVSEITHRGRKQKYGIVFATQSPKDIDRDIVDLCDTKIVLRLPGYRQWVLENLGKSFLKEVADLKTFNAIISVGGKHDPIRIQMPIVLGKAETPLLLANGKTSDAEKVAETH